MNFIKKRIKGPKKHATHHDDDDLDPNEFHVPHAQGKGAPQGWVPYDERVDEESEEWLAFKRLTQRVSDTLQKTEENLTKIVATSVISGDKKDIEEVHLDDQDAVSDGLHLKEYHPSASKSKPGRPPPPRPAPPRPPPPGASAPDAGSEDPFENSTQDFSTFDFESEQDRKPVAKTGNRLEFDLHSEFGFTGSSPARTPILPPSTGSLFLDHETDPDAYDEVEEDDPFDTSFAAAHVTTTRSTKATGDLELIGSALSIPIDNIKGIVSVEQVLAASGLSLLKDDDEDDPFVVKDSVLSGTGTYTSPDMDPFDSYMSPPATTAKGRSKSPNPFITDDDDEPEVLHSSNPFASAGSGDTESYFGGQGAPNPFADIMNQQQTASNLLELGFSDGTGEVAKPDVMMDNFFGSPPDVSSSRKNSNPFAAYATTTDMAATNDFFSMDLLGAGGDDHLPQPLTSAPSIVGGGPPPKPPPPKVASAAPPSGFGDHDDLMNATIAETSLPPPPPPTSVMSSFVASSDFGVDPFGGSSDAAMSGAKVLGSFGLDSDVKIEPFPSAEELVSPPKVPEVGGGRRIRPSMPDIFDAEIRNMENALDNINHDDVLPPVTASIDVFSSLLTGPSTDVTLTTSVISTSIAGSKAPPPSRPPPPAGGKAGPPSRPPPPSVAITGVPVETTFETWDAFASKEDSDSKMEDSQFFNAFDGAAPPSTTASGIRPPRPPSIFCPSQDSTPSDPFGGDTMPESTDCMIMHPEDKVEFEPIPLAIQKLAGDTTTGFDAFNFSGGDFASAQQPGMDLFSGFDDGPVHEVPPPAPTTVTADLPRPPSVDAMDAFASTEVTTVVAAPTGFQSSDLFEDSNVNFMADSSAFGVLSPTMASATTPIMEATPAPFSPRPPATDAVPFTDSDTFDAFDAKFQSTGLHHQGAVESGHAPSDDAFDPFADLGSLGGGGQAGGGTTAHSEGFGVADEFDPFFAIKEVPAAPKPSPARFYTKSSDAPESPDSDEDGGQDFAVFIRPKMRDKDSIAPKTLGVIPVLAPPPKSPMRSPPDSHTSPTPRFNPFDKDVGSAFAEQHGSSAFDETASVATSDARTPPHSLPGVGGATPGKLETAGSQDESPGSPLFDLDDTEPLEDFHPKYPEDGWDLMLRQPSKKKLTGQRFWKKVFVTLSDNGVLHLYNKKDDKDAFQELPLQACYSLSEVSTQQYDNYGKIFTVKLQYVFYRERVGVRPGQISKVAHGQITSLGQLAKLGLPLEHAPQVSQLLKLGTQNFMDLKPFVRELEDTLFRLTVHRDRALTYKTEEMQVTVIDELRAEVGPAGIVRQQLARVRVFLLAFITSMPDVELGLNDITKQGKEVVGRHDIIPVITEEWIRLEKVEFHSCVMQEEFEKSRTIKFHPPDACFFELLRFRIRPPRNRELPLQVKTTMSLIGNRVEIRADVLVPGCISRKHGQIPCEDVAIRFPIPECWIYLFRVEKHFRYGSVKSAARKPGKIKGLDRIMGGGLSMEPSLIEVSTGQAKYEHHHRAIVWRIPRLPKDGQGAYTTQLFVCRMELTSYDQIPEEFSKYVYVEFHMPATTVSHTTVRSVSVTNPNPPEKYVKYLARHEYRTEIEMVTITSECEYVSATTVNSNSGATTNGASAAGNNSSPVPSQ